MCNAQFPVRDAESCLKMLEEKGEIYTSVYYIDLFDNSFFEITSSESVHRHIGNAGIAQERLDYFSRNMVTAEFTDELLDFVNLKTLGEELSKSEKVGV